MGRMLPFLWLLIFAINRIFFRRGLGCYDGFRTLNAFFDCSEKPVCVKLRMAQETL